jgi:hypothetical protein
MNTLEDNKLTKSPSSTRTRDSGTQGQIVVGRRLLHERGAALIVVLLLAVLSLSIGLFAAQGAKTELHIEANDLVARQALAIAEAGLQHAYLLIKNDAVDGLNDEIQPDGLNSGTGGAGSGLIGMDTSSVVLLNEPDGTSKQYRSRSFGGGTYFVRVEDNVDETTGANNTANDVDRRIRVIVRGNVGSAERIVQAMVQGGFPVVGLFGTVSVTVRTGVNSCDGSLVFPCNSAGPFGNSAAVGSDGSIDLDNAPIGGNVTAAGAITNSGGVTGTVTPSASPRNFPPAATVAPFSCPPYTSSTAGIHGTYTYTSGDLSTSNDITFDPGTYCFNSLNQTGGSFIINTGPVTIYLDSGASIIKNVDNQTHQAANLSLFSNGGSLIIESGAGSHMSIYAPNTDLTFQGSGGHFFGSAIGRTVLLQGGNWFHHDLNLGLGATSTQLVGWHEVRN